MLIHQSVEQGLARYLQKRIEKKPQNDLTKNCQLFHSGEEGRTEKLYYGGNEIFINVSIKV